MEILEVEIKAEEIKLEASEPDWLQETYQDWADVKMKTEEDEDFHGFTTKQCETIFQCDLCDYVVRSRSDNQHIVWFREQKEEVDTNVDVDTGWTMNPEPMEGDAGLSAEQEPIKNVTVLNADRESTENEAVLSADQEPVESVVEQNDNAKTANKKPLLSCDKCDYKSEWDFALRHHQEHHRITPKSLQMFDCMEEPKKYECNSCDYRTTMSLQLMEHIQTEHQSKALPLINLVVYSDTGVKIPEPKRKKKKKVVEVETKPEECVTLKCFNCDFMKFSEMFLVKHNGAECKPRFLKLEHFPPGESQGVSESIRKVIKLHNKLGVTVTVYQFKCLHCFQEHDEKLQAMSLLKSMQHLKCYHCSYETTNKMYLKGHIANRHSLPEHIRWFECDHCPYKAKTRCQLKKHVTFTHDNVRNFPCELCPYRAKYKLHLQMHMDNVHTDTKPFPCHQCSYRAKNKPNLHYHVLTQHEEKGEWFERFQCEHCPYKARWRYMIKKHTMNRHTPAEFVKWYPCLYCDYKAKRTTHVKLHMNNVHKNKLKTVLKKEKEERE